MTEVELSPKQTRVLEAIGDGLTYPQIAERLSISERTVRAYVDLLRRKFSTNGVMIPTGRALIPIAREWLAARG
jgi:DNA-binding NarL/FixJ family response regulator